MDLVAIVSRPDATTGKQSVSLWRMTGQASASTPVWTVIGLTDVRSLAWSPDGLILAIAYESKIHFQSVHPPASSAARTFAPRHFPHPVLYLEWLPVDLPTLPEHDQIALVESFHPLRETPPSAGPSSLVPVTNRIDPAARIITAASLEGMAPNFPILPQGTDHSVLAVVSKTEGTGCRLDLLLGGGVPLRTPISLPYFTDGLDIRGLHLHGDILHFVCTTDEGVEHDDWPLEITVDQRHTAQAATLAHSLLSNAIAQLEVAATQWGEVYAEGRNWLARADPTSPTPHLALMHLLVTGRSPKDVAKEHFSARASERSYDKWELASMQAQTRLSAAAWHVCAPSVERIAILFPSAEVAQRSEEAYRATLVLEEMSKIEQRLFTEVAKWLRHELARGTQADQDPPSAGTATNHAQAPTHVPAYHNARLVGDWLLGLSTGIDSLARPTHELFAALQRLADAVSRAASGGATAAEPAESAEDNHEDIFRWDATTTAEMDDRRTRTRMTAEGDLLVACLVEGQLRLETSDHPGRWLRASADLVTPDGQDLDIADFGFFDDLELAFLARVKGERVYALVTVALADLEDDTGGPLPVSRCQPLQHGTVEAASLALNGRAGRRLGCVALDRTLEVFDMDPVDEEEEEEEAGGSIEED